MASSRTRILPGSSTSPQSRLMMPRSSRESVLRSGIATVVSIGMGTLPARPFRSTGQCRVRDGSTTGNLYGPRRAAATVVPARRP